MYLGDKILGENLNETDKTEFQRQIVETIDAGLAGFMTVETPDRTISFLLTAATTIRFETTDPVNLDPTPLGKPS
ncbi:hypothetical protein EDF63_1608 [Curtobacterium sp. JUb34]|nr:hypothetical protein EDF63_1608 [Curtobacterium sp. JUb34]